MIGDREREITIQEYSKLNDRNVRQVQEEDPELNVLYKALEAFKLLNLTGDKQNEQK